jgi:hypothetical protein
LFPVIFSLFWKEVFSISGEFSARAVTSQPSYFVPISSIPALQGVASGLLNPSCWNKSLDDPMYQQAGWRHFQMVLNR